MLVALCSPLMRRAHQFLPQSEELVFIDSSGGVDRSGCRIFLMLTNSPAGRVPLGALITTSESEKVISEALVLWKGILPKEAFHGKGYPKVFMTDDNSAEQKALQLTFPQSIMVLCSFHVLQALYRWLYTAKNGIAKSHRSHLLNLVRKTLNAHFLEEQH